jgi:hypothetical protein
MLGDASAADYIFEQSVIKGVGYRSHELFGQTAQGGGQKLVERISGSGSFDDRTVFELDVIGNSINYSQDADFEYFPTSYQTGTYDQKWIDKLCVQNYDAGAVMTESYSQAERLQESTEVKTMGNTTWNGLEAHLSTNVIGVVHIGWASKETKPNEKGRYAQLGRSTEDAVGVFSIEKYIELLQNGTDCGQGTDWMPCARTLSNRSHKSLDAPFPCP